MFHKPKLSFVSTLVLQDEEVTGIVFSILKQCSFLSLPARANSNKVLTLNEDNNFISFHCFSDKDIALIRAPLCVLKVQLCLVGVMISD